MKILIGVVLCLGVTTFAEELKAIVLLKGTGTVEGNITFTQSDPSGPVTVTGVVVGLEANKNYGFHVHAKGDITGGCASTGGHFNPENKQHGAPTSSERHVGDLGNILSNDAGVANVNIVDKEISLCGAHNILGRAVVVHTGTDDLGLGGHKDSKTTGNAGGRAACGVIGILSPEGSWKTSNGSGLFPNLILSVFITFITFTCFN